MPHTYNDLYWFSTGASFDSPYGDWVASAARPYPSMCAAIPDKDYIGTYTNQVASQYITGKIYASFVADPPRKQLTGTAGLDCIENQGTHTCTAVQVGTVPVGFDFGATYAKFYARTYIPSHPLTGAPACYTSNEPMQERSSDTTPDGQDYYFSPFSLQIPPQQIACPITVAGPVGNPPGTPTLKSGGACTVGTPQNISMVSADPDGDTLRYGVDWDADGSIDQWVPGAGYVSSGTMQTASRTYAIAGAKSVKALAQDKNGNTSGWASVSFSCAGSTTVGLNGEGGTLQLLPDLDIRVIPSLVRSGNTTKANWSSTNVKSCTVSGENGDAWSGLQSILGGNISKPITGETTYTLSCLALDGTTLTKSATVRIIPTFQEL